MKRIALLFPFLLLAVVSLAQEPVPAPSPADDTFDMSAVEIQPQFPGGDDALLKYVADHVVYPQEALEAGLQGRVYVEFIVDKQGQVSEVTIKRGASPSLDAEAVRVVRILPAFAPGTMNGKPVKVRYMLPIVFKLT